MIAIASLRVKGWLCFRDESTLVLSLLVYAIVACRTSNPDSSNWAGKSALIESVQFALYGTHRFRTEDEIISHGEPIAEVEIVLTSGVRIRRRRERGKRTTVFFYPKDGGEPMIQAEAEKAIVELVGLTQEDSEATCYFEQKKMSRFVTTEPAARMKMVSDWLRLEPLERCEKRAVALGSEMEAESKRIEGHLAALDQRQEDIEQKGKWSGETLRIAAGMSEKTAETLRGKIALLEVEQEKNAQRMAAEARRREFAEVVAEGKKLKAEVDALGIADRAKKHAESKKLAEDAAVLEHSLSAEHGKRLRLVQSRFDGRCPVAGIECPATERINANVEALKAGAEAAGAACREARPGIEAAVNRERVDRAALQEAERVVRRLDSLREQAKRLQVGTKESEPAEDPALVRGRLEKERGALVEAMTTAERARGLADELGKIEATREVLRAKRAELAEALSTIREAVVIFGKQGAQRRVAESALSAIEGDANELLKDCGIDLRVEVRWSREGKGLAKACEQCGAPFPASAKVKACERCGTVRGNQLENKLDVVLSNRSGAAEDLAGAAVQLAASRWLREQRGTAWSLALLDEPFGACDKANRKALGLHLGAMLRRTGLEQALVVSHTADTTNAMPGRIEVESDGTWAKARVVS
jgi:DNA repair exonuclease SbcCD ATPase subunit